MDNMLAEILQTIKINDDVIVDRIDEPIVHL